MLYQISKGLKFYGSQTVLDQIQFSLDEQEKVAIVGRNGAGKTTLLKIMMGEITLDDGDIHQSGKLNIGYLSQHVFADEQRLIKDELEEVFGHFKAMEQSLQQYEQQMAYDHSEKLLDAYAKLSHQYEELGGYAYQAELMTLFTKFGFVEAELEKPISDFSGGQRTRLALIKLLLSKPDILLLDEPTNHLDLETISWLEGYLKRYPKAMVLVSHDRKFIDNIATSVCEIEFGKLTKYHGNYSHFVAQKKIMQEKQKASFIRQGKEIERIQAQIEKFRYKSSKAKFAQSKIKFLERMERVSDVSAEEQVFQAHFKSKRKGGKLVCSMEDLAIGYDHTLATLTMDLYHGAKIAVIGANGIGKSTLLKTLAQAIDKRGGEFLLGHQIDLGYFDQDVSGFDPANSVLEELWEDFPNLTHTQVRSALGAFLFQQDDVFKQICDLSGGEKVRLLLAKLMLREDNFLLLDEPTNHLDLLSKEALEEALREYDGTMLFVSHDRYFISKLATSLLVFEPTGVKYVQATYEEYTNTQKEETQSKKETQPKGKRSSNVNYGKEIKKIEQEIERVEQEMQRLEQLQFDEAVYNDYQKMQEITKQIQELEEKLNISLNKWEEYSKIVLES
ncbi:MAG: ABC-F family ATP-binding cassette domain-containing protein [Erysipelotrichaceae bacterium]